MTFSLYINGYVACSRDTMDAVKQSSALCLLRLIRNSADAIPMSEWASRVIHLLNDQHMVRNYQLLVATSGWGCNWVVYVQNKNQSPSSKQNTVCVVLAAIAFIIYHISYPPPPQRLLFPLF